MEMKNTCRVVSLLWGSLTAANLLGIPTVPFHETGGHFKLSTLNGITVDLRYCKSRDEKGQTLIPPTLLEFASTFAADLRQPCGKHVKVSTGEHSGHESIFVTIGNNSQ